MQLAFESAHTRDLITEKMQPLKKEERLAKVLEEMKGKYPVRFPHTPR